MNIRSKNNLLIPALAVGMAFAIAASAHAQGSATLRVTFGSAPHWTGISNSRVEEIRQGERPDYDMFRYGNRYYAYNNSRWYASDQPMGDFTYVDDRSVPSELAMVPRDHWRNYPSEWQNRNAQDPNGTMQVDLGRSPRWSPVRGTRVREIRQGRRPGYDMFRYGNNYYVYNNNRWYRSRQWRGNFVSIEDRSVPTELSRVPRDHWHNYPQGWGNPAGPRTDNPDQRRH
jgi:hypothetical protein